MALVVNDFSIGIVFFAGQYVLVLLWLKSWAQKLATGL